MWRLTEELSRTKGLDYTMFEFDVKIGPSEKLNMSDLSLNTTSNNRSLTTTAPLMSTTTKSLYSAVNTTIDNSPAANNLPAAASSSLHQQHDISNRSQQWCSKQGGVNQKWCVGAFRLISDYQNMIRSQVSNHSWDGNFPNEEYEPKWRYSEALLYAVSAITTIGEKLLLSLSGVTSKVQRCLLIANCKVLF